MKKEIVIGNNYLKIRVAEIFYIKNEVGDYEVNAKISAWIKEDRIEFFLKKLEQLIKENLI